MLGSKKNAIKYISKELMKYGTYTRIQADKRAKELVNIPKSYYYTFNLIESNVMKRANKYFKF